MRWGSSYSMRRLLFFTSATRLIILELCTTNMQWVQYNDFDSELLSAYPLRQTRRLFTRTSQGGNHTRHRKTNESLRVFRPTAIDCTLVLCTNHREVLVSQSDSLQTPIQSRPWAIPLNARSQVLYHSFLYASRKPSLSTQWIPTCERESRKRKSKPLP